MAGGGWQHMAEAAKELADATQSKAKVLTQSLGKAAVSTGRELQHFVEDAYHSSHAQQAQHQQQAQPPRDPQHQQQEQELVDCYGFRLHLTADQAAIVQRCRLKQQHVAQKWQQHPLDQGLPPPDVLKRLCRKGVPPDMRRRVWLELSGANQRRQRYPPHYYASSALQGSESAFAHQIGLDVPRTFPDNEWVQSEAGQNSLRHVLHAFAHHNPHVGYCQSMNYLGAMLLLVLDHEEEDAFWLLASLIDDNDNDGILYNDMYARDLSGTHVEMRCLRELVQHKLPRLAGHMDAIGCDMSILATDWFLCLFCTSLPSETVCRIWDALLNEGTKVLFRVALALLKLHEPLLLAQDNPGELLQAARRQAANAYDRDALMKVAFEGVGSMPMDTIRRYRARKQREVDREMAARETRVNLKQAVAEQGYVVQQYEAELLALQAAEAAGGEAGGMGADGHAAAVHGGAAGAAGAAGAGGGVNGGGASGGSSSVPPSPLRGSGGSGGGSRWVSQLQALGSSIGDKAKKKIDRGRILIAHRRGQSLGGSFTL